MSDRDDIFARIAEALTVPAPRPGHAQAATMESPASRWLPPVGEAFEERAELFGVNAIELRADFRLLNSLEECRTDLHEICQHEGWAKIGTHRGTLTNAVCSVLDDLPVYYTDQSYDVNELESCDVGITECDALIGQTGTVLVTARSAGGRALSVLPPHHVVLARREQLLPDLPAAFSLLKEKYGSDYPSFISLITGPSRTGDIERILVLGAHGPRKLTILCW
ncbi:MAG: LUD domain-containing protein [Verrucomicrobiota bacterium]|nr:LUD domain-containing protein [Verrucomicrobiota bacterium]